MKKIILSIGIVFLIVIGLVVFKLLSIRGEFESYLKVKYPENSFHVEIPKIDIIYGSFYSEVFCIDDSVTFSISKSWNTENISEQYLIIKNQEKMNLEIAEVFSGTMVEKYLSNISVDGGKIPTADVKSYDGFYISLVPDCDMAAVTKEVFGVLKEKGISVESIIFYYEVDLSVYEGHFSNKDYDLKEEEIKGKIIKIK